jgi:hypothetical protein
MEGQEKKGDGRLAKAGGLPFLTLSLAEAASAGKLAAV